MRELNVKFMDKYKRLDNLLKQRYDSKDGVTEYINQMENRWNDGVNKVSNFEYIYKRLKHVRWLRNQLAHEVDFETNIVEHSDLNFVNDFYDSVINLSDALSLLQKSKGKLFSVKQSKNNKNEKRQAKKNAISTRKRILTAIAIVVLVFWAIKTIRNCLA